MGGGDCQRPLFFGVASGDNTEQDNFVRRMAEIAFLALLATLTCASASSPAAPDAATIAQAAQLVAEADSNYRSGEFETSLRGLREAEGLLPTDPAIQFRLGQVYEALNDKAGAFAAFQRSVLVAGLPKEVREQAEQKMARLTQVLSSTGGSAISAPADTPRKIGGWAIRDELGLVPGSVLGIGDAILRDSQPGAKILRIAVKSRRGTRVDTERMNVHVWFYELDQSQQVQVTKAKPSTKWVNPPVNWRDGKPELLDIEYPLPDGGLPGSSADAGALGRVFYGYRIAVYYRGELQDMHSDPQSISVSFPTVRSLNDESTLPPPSLQHEIDEIQSTRKESADAAFRPVNLSAVRCRKPANPAEQATLDKIVLACLPPLGKIAECVPKVLAMPPPYNASLCSMLGIQKPEDGNQSALSAANFASWLEDQIQSELDLASAVPGADSFLLADLEHYRSAVSAFSVMAAMTENRNTHALQIITKTISSEGSTADPRIQAAVAACFLPIREAATLKAEQSDSLRIESATHSENGEFEKSVKALEQASSLDLRTEDASDILRLRESAKKRALDSLGL